MGYHRKRERDMDRKREKRGMQCYMKKEDNSLIDVENVETTCRRKVSPSELTNTIEQFIVCVHRNEAHFTYIYVYHTKWLTTFTKTLPQMSFHLYLFAIFISLWGSTHDSAHCWSAHRSSATRDSFKRVHD